MIDEHQLARPPKHRYSADDVAALKQMWAQDESVASIARALNRTVSSIKRKLLVLRRTGDVSGRDRWRKTRLTKQQKKEARETAIKTRRAMMLAARADGKTFAEIAEQFGLNRNYVRLIIAGKTSETPQKIDRSENDDVVKAKRRLSDLTAKGKDIYSAIRIAHGEGIPPGVLAHATGYRYARVYAACKGANKFPRKYQYPITAQVLLTGEHVESAKRLGAGNISAGIRRALELAAAIKQTCPAHPPSSAPPTIS